MTAEQAHAFGRRPCILRNGREVLIRPLQKEDRDRLLRFYEGVPREDYRFYLARKLDAGLADWRAAQADDPLWVCLLGCDAQSGEVLGYAWYGREKSEEKKSYFGICSARACQGQGLGRHLMESLLEIGRTDDPEVMSLEVQKANPHAVRLYQSMGFEVVREQMRPAQGEFEAEAEYYMERRM